jgi:NAD(P)-dependent dehydrogenase (short-subunit alcohol dehydrogenase family)
MKANPERPVALIAGAGDGLGAAIARRFAREGFHVVAVRRRGDLGRLTSAIASEGGIATGIHADMREEAEVQDLVRRVEEEIGPIGVAVFNVGANVRFPILETTSRVYRKVWEMCAFGGFLFGREIVARMLPRGEGTILFTGATASVRGGSGFAAFAGGKHALRALAQSMAREVGPLGIHVAHIVIDGPIDNDNTRRVFPEAFSSRPADGIIPPEAIAEIYWHIHCQPKAAWTFETDVRSYVEPW